MHGIDLEPKRKNDDKRNSQPRYRRLIALVLICAITGIVLAYTTTRRRVDMPSASLAYTDMTSGPYLLDLQTGERTRDLWLWPIPPRGEWRVTTWGITDIVEDEAEFPLILHNTTNLALYVDTGRLAPLQSDSWSSDNQWIVFPSARANCASDLSKTFYTSVPVTPRARTEYCMDAPMGAGDSSYTELWLFNVHTGESFPFTSNDATEEKAFFSPRQPQILYTVSGNLYLFDVSTREERLLMESINIRRFVWSPDGQWIAFTSGPYDGPHDLFIIRPDGTDLMHIEANVNPHEAIGWAP